MWLPGEGGRVLPVGGAAGCLAQLEGRSLTGGSGGNTLGLRYHGGLLLACCKDLTFLLCKTGSLWRVLYRWMSDCCLKGNSEVWGWIKWDNVRKSTQYLECSKHTRSARSREERPLITKIKPLEAYLQNSVSSRCLALDLKKQSDFSKGCSQHASRVYPLWGVGRHINGREDLTVQSPVARSESCV